MSGVTVGDVMTVHPVSVREDATFKELVDVLESRQVGAVPVVDEDNRVVGVVSATDLMHRMEFAGGAEPKRLVEIRKHRGQGQAGRRVGCRPDVLASSHRVGQRPRRGGGNSHGLDGCQAAPGLSTTSDRLVGVVTPRDLLKVFFRDGEEISYEVRAQILPAVLGYQASSVTVDVEDHRVRLFGTLDLRSIVERIVKLVEGVDGVVSVTNMLLYREDDVVSRLRISRVTKGSGRSSRGCLAKLRLERSVGPVGPDLLRRCLLRDFPWPPTIPIRIPGSCRCRRCPGSISTRCCRSCWTGSAR